jgi:hypothetical protein
VVLKWKKRVMSSLCISINTGHMTVKLYSLWVCARGTKHASDALHDLKALRPEKLSPVPAHPGWTRTGLMWRRRKTLHPCRDMNPIARPIGSQYTV